MARKIYEKKSIYGREKQMKRGVYQRKNNVLPVVPADAATLSVEEEAPKRAPKSTKPVVEEVVEEKETSEEETSEEEAE